MNCWETISCRNTVEPLLTDTSEERTPPLITDTYSSPDCSSIDSNSKATHLAITYNGHIFCPLLANSNTNRPRYNGHSTITTPTIQYSAGCSRPHIHLRPGARPGVSTINLYISLPSPTAYYYSRNWLTAMSMRARLCKT